MRSGDANETTFTLRITMVSSSVCLSLRCPACRITVPLFGRLVLVVLVAAEILALQSTPSPLMPWGWPESPLFPPLVPGPLVSPSEQAAIDAAARATRSGKRDFMADLEWVAEPEFRRGPVPAPGGG